MAAPSTSQQEICQLVGGLVAGALADGGDVAPLLAFARLAAVYQQTRYCSYADRVLIAEQLRDLADLVDRREAVHAG